MASRPSQEKLIRCAHCGEEYSPTYRKCPFCGMRNDPRTAQVSQGSRSSRTTPSDPDPELTRAIPRVDGTGDGSGAAGRQRPDRREEDDDDGYVFDGQDLFDEDDDDGEEDDYRPARGGKRLAGGNGGGKSGRPASAKINWPRVITFLCSLIIIIAAMVILFTIIYPQLRKDPAPQSSDPAGSGQVQPSEPAQTGEPVQPSGPAAPSANAGGEPEPLIGISVDRPSVDLPAGGTYQFVPVFDPAGWSGQVTFTSSDERYATVDENGVVANVNTEAGAAHTVTITISAEGIDLLCTVNCAGPEAQEPPETISPAGEGDIPAGTQGVIAGADGGLNVRSGPGTTYDKVASLSNGDAVTVVSYAGDGWYEITFIGSDGEPSPGYIMGEYISAG